MRAAAQVIGLVFIVWLFALGAFYFIKSAANRRKPKLRVVNPETAPDRMNEEQ